MLLLAAVPTLLLGSCDFGGDEGNEESEGDNEDGEEDDD
jgi:hypothetical protein